MQESNKYLPGGKICAEPQSDHERTEADGDSEQRTGMPEASGHFQTKAPILLCVPASRIKLKLHGEEKRCFRVKLKENGNLPHESREQPVSVVKSPDPNGFSLYKVFTKDSPAGMFMMLEKTRESDLFIDIFRRRINDFVLMPCAHGAWSSLSEQDPGRRRMPWHYADQAEKLRDETERRRAVENQLHESEKTFRLALDTSFNGVWDLNLDTGEINFGNNWYRILGYENRSEISDRRSWHSLIHPSDLGKILAMHNALAHGASTQCEVEYRIKDTAGGWLWILSRGRVLTRDEKGNVLRIIGIDTDITRLKQTESELKAAGTELEQQLLARTTELHSTQIALEVLLRKREADRASLEEPVMHNIDRFVEPFLARLEESRLTERQRKLLELLRDTFKELTCP